MTGRSICVNRYEEDIQDQGGVEHLGSAPVALNLRGSGYLSVDPMAEAREWYELPMEDRQLTGPAMSMREAPDALG